MVLGIGRIAQGWKYAVTSNRDSAYLRAELARNAGIFLDEPAAFAATDDVGLFTAGGEVIDRAEVQRILVEAGAPAKDLEWLTTSCPSLEHARGYRAPPRYAWCVECCGATACDDGGCIGCRGGS